MKVVILIYASALLIADFAEASSETLLIHDTLSKPFSMVNEIAPIQTAVSRFDSKVNTRTSKGVEVSDVQSADFIILAGITDFPNLSRDVLDELKKTSKRVLAIGAAAGFASNDSSTVSIAAAHLEKAHITYRGHEWVAPIDPFFGRSCSGAKTLIGLSGKNSPPLAWQAGNRYAFAALPSDRLLSMLFVDVLLDFYGEENQPSACMVFLVEDFNPSCNPATLRRLVDYFAYRKFPFLVSVQMSEVPPGSDLCPRDQFLDAIRYAVSHGGRILLHGPNGGARLETFRKEGIEIAGREGILEPGEGFQIGNHLIQRIPGEAPVPWVSAVPMRTSKGGVMLSPNVRAGVDGTANEELKSTLREISAFRGAVAVVLVPAWMRFQDSMAALQAAESTDLPVIDALARFTPRQR